MNIIVLKTIGGEEIIAELIETLSNSVVVSRPRVLTISPQGAGLMPYLMSDPENKHVAIAASSIAVQTPAPKDIADAYMKSVTNIQLLS